MSTNANARFRKSQEQQWCMRFKTKVDKNDQYDGIIVHQGRSFVALREVRELGIDGLILLQKGVIRGFRDGVFEQCANEILRQSDAMRRLKVPSWVLRCQTFRDVLQQMHTRSIWPGLETLRADGSGAFYLGPLQDVSKETVSIKAYDAAGRWESVYDLPIREIVRVEFDSAYCNRFNDYMRSQEAS